MILIVILIIVLFGTVPFGFGHEPEEPECVAVSATTGESSDGCGAAPASDSWQLVRIGEVEGVIVTEADAALFVGAGAYWTPTLAELQGADAALTWEEGSLEHRRQYAGFIEAGGPKILINGFCDDHGIDWRQTPVLVLDGGDCSFTAVYAVDTDSLERFDFNGEA